jgi:quercetin dioxygenase-like cupin family protein
VLSGRVVLTAGTDSWEGRGGDLLLIPPTRHALRADDDSVVVLTVAKLGVPGREDSGPARDR